MSNNLESEENQMSSANTIIFEDLRIFTGHEFIDRGFVVVKNGQISEVGKGDSPKEIATAKRISAPDATLLPGLIDGHLHGLFGSERCIEDSLKFGITTVMDMHNEPHHIEKLKKLAASDRSRYADFLCSGTAATVEGGWPAPVVLGYGKTPQALKTVDSWPKLSSPEQAEGYVQNQVEQCGISYVKIMHELGDTLALPNPMPQPDIDVWRAVVHAAHDRGLIAVGHAFSYSGAMGLLEAGIDGLTHIWMDEPISDEIIALLKKNKAHCNPTLSCIASQTKQGYELKVAFSQDPLAKRMLADTTPPGYLALANHKGNVENAYNNTRALYKAGVPLILGSDASGQAKGQTFGLTLHMELWQMMHVVGMKPIEALKSVTSLIAERFGMKDRGSIETGKKADLVLLQGDVEAILSDRDFHCLPVIGVWRNGVPAVAFASAQ